MSKTLGNLALICQKWSLKLLLLKSGGTRAVQKGAKKALPLIITNSKAKKKGAHFEHLNYHLLSILIVVYHDLFSYTELPEFIPRKSMGKQIVPLIMERMINPSLALYKAVLEGYETNDDSKFSESEQIRAIRCVKKWLEKQ